ncbi:MAG TPA: hypothetical protein VH540_18540 [Ktedonobacterales bacterium]|jgi:hypothetical protein
MPSRKNRIMATLIILPIIIVVIVAVISRVAGSTSSAKSSATATAGKTTHHLFMTSATENEVPNLVTFPLHQGTSNGQTVYYVITESSDQADAMARGVNFVQKLAKAKGTPAVQVVQADANGVLDFPASVDFSPARVIEASATGFPPNRASPPAVGQDGYSPLIQLPSGIVLNAPQVANTTGQADKIVSLDLDDMKVTYRETMGFYEDKQVHYVSFDSSSPVASAIEDVTYAPALGMAPGEDNEDASVSAREELIAFVNGPTGAANPNRQGLNSALLDGMDPLNLLHKAPQDVPDYSPLWDVHFAAWTDAAIKAGKNTRQIDFDDVKTLIQKGGLVTGPDGKAFGAAGFIVNCPIISVDIGPGQSL